LKPNAINFFDIRETKFACPHFEVMNLKQQYNLEDALRKWIMANLKGRFNIGKTMVLDSSNQYQNHLTVGFEDPKELSYFMLACPHLKY
jgi:hypothetical protein